MMADVRTKLSALWAALMPAHPLGDVLRVLGGDSVAGETGGARTMHLQSRWIAHLPFSLRRVLDRRGAGPGKAHPPDETPKVLDDADEGHGRGKVVISAGHSRETQRDKR